MMNLVMELQTKRWNELLTDESNPLLNRCISGLYSPGSTYKLINGFICN